MQLFTNIDKTGVTEAILPYVNIIKGYKDWTDEETKLFYENLKEIYYIAPYIDNQGNFIRNNSVETISFRLDGKLGESGKESFSGLMHIVDSGHLFRSTGTYGDYEAFIAWFPLFVSGKYCASNSGDDYLYFKVFDNKEEAEEELRKWNEMNTAKQQEKKKYFIIRSYNNLIKEKDSIERKISDMKKDYNFLT